MGKVSQVSPSSFLPSPLVARTSNHMTIIVQESSIRPPSFPSFFSQPPQKRVFLFCLLNFSRNKKNAQFHLWEFFCSTPSSQCQLAEEERGKSDRVLWMFLPKIVSSTISPLFSPSEWNKIHCIVLFSRIQYLVLRTL